MTERHGRINKRAIWFIALVVGLVGSLVISRRDHNSRSSVRHGNRAATESIEPSDPAEKADFSTNIPVRLSAVDRPGYDAALAKLRGKIVLVDFWATWCEPCVEHLPHTLALGDKLSDRGLAIVTVSCDEANDSAQVAAFLTSKKGAGATNLISQFGGSPKTMEELEISTGAVPFYKLYDRSGKLRQTFGIQPTAAKQFTAANIEAAVERLLAE
jgi:thiol-disulfide isomerase/thioredoxin